jgi:hypothetical protein
MHAFAWKRQERERKIGQEGTHGVNKNGKQSARPGNPKTAE